MVFQENNRGEWMMKKKFSFAAITLLIGTAIAYKGVSLATTTEQVVVLLSSFGTFAGWLLGLVFAADVADKKLNNGSYTGE